MSSSAVHEPGKLYSLQVGGNDVPLSTPISKNAYAQLILCPFKRNSNCTGLYYDVIHYDREMGKTITVRLDDPLERRLDSVSKRTGLSRSDIVRDALRRQLAILAFEKHREMAMPFAEARGYLTDEDVFDAIS